jgi:aspartate aminotransferase-like enzyme
MSTQNPVFIPGPTNIPDRLRRAIDVPTIDHRSNLFAEAFRPAVEGVKRILKTRTSEVIIFPATGTGGWEAAVTNTLSPGDKVRAGQLLVVVEAMKMEHSVTAPRDGTVASVACAEGDRVEDGIELVTLDA